MGVRDSELMPDAEAAVLTWYTGGSTECPMLSLLLSASAWSLPTLLEGIAFAPGLSCLWVC